jgi:Domain of unknown function (DUF1995)
MGPKVWLLTSGGVSNAFLAKAEVALKGSSATIVSLRQGTPDELSKGDVCIFITPNGRGDYKAAKDLAESKAPKAVVIVNGSAKVSRQQRDAKTISRYNHKSSHCLSSISKDQDSVSGKATMAYYLKPLTYNSQVAGYLVRSYPSDWTVLDAVTKKSLGSFSDTEILFGDSNTPDLRNSGRLVQKSMDDRAIAARSR